MLPYKLGPDDEELYDCLDCGIWFRKHLQLLVTPKKIMNYFDSIAKRVQEIDDQAQEYLNHFKFIPSDEMAKRIWKNAWAAFRAAGEDWEKCPEWAASVIDMGVPFTPDYGNRDGSLYATLALSLASRDAHLRHLFEMSEGRASGYLGFPVMAEREIVNKYSGLAKTNNPNKPKKTKPRILK